MLLEHVVVILGRLREHALSAETTAAYLHWTFAGVSYLGTSAGSPRQCPTPGSLLPRPLGGCMLSEARIHAAVGTPPPASPTIKLTIPHQRSTRRVAK